MFVTRDPENKWNFHPEVRRLFVLVTPSRGQRRHVTSSPAQEHVYPQTTTLLAQLSCESGLLLYTSVSDSSVSSCCSFVCVWSEAR